MLETKTLAEKLDEGQQVEIFFDDEDEGLTIRVNGVSLPDIREIKIVAVNHGQNLVGEAVIRQWTQSKGGIVKWVDHIVPLKSLFSLLNPNVIPTPGELAPNA